MGMLKNWCRHVYATAYKYAGIYWHQEGQLVSATVCRKLSYGVDVVVRRSVIHNQDGAVLRPANPIKTWKQHLSAHCVPEFYRKHIFHEFGRIYIRIKIAAILLVFQFFMTFLAHFTLVSSYALKSTFSTLFKIYNRKKMFVDKQT